MTGELEPCYSCICGMVVTHQFGDVSVICQCPNRENGLCTCKDAKAIIRRIGGI